MGAEINDEFSQLPISRQRKYYLRQRRDRRCTKCGKPVDRGSLCLEHMVQMREYRRKTFNLKRRYRGSFSYQAEAALAQGDNGGPKPGGQGSNGSAVTAFKLPTIPMVATAMAESLEKGVPPDHPLRSVKARVDRLLANALHAFDPAELRSPIPPQVVLKAWVLITLYSVRSPKLFCEQLGYNLLWLWFMDRTLAHGSFDPAEFERAYDQMLSTDAARQFLTQVFSSGPN